MNLTPEQYKQLAEFAGHEAQIIEYPHPFMDGGMATAVRIKTDDPQGAYEEFDPLVIDYTPDTNDAQVFELLRAYTKKHNVYILGEETDAKLVTLGRVYEAPTLNLAICHAVLAIGGEG